MTSSDSRFEEDGWAERARIGLIVPDNDVGPESEWSVMCPRGVSIHASRFSFPVGPIDGANDVVSTNPIERLLAPGPLDDAAALLPSTRLNLIALAFTSTSYVGGSGGDEKLVQRLLTQTKQCPVITTGQSILAALSALNARQVMLVDPPWFPPALTAAGKQWLLDNGIKVDVACAAGIASGLENITADGLYGWLVDEVDPGCDTIVIGGNGFRAVATIRRLEEQLGVSVLSANSALLWHALGCLNLPRHEVTRYGRAFSVG